MMKSNKPIPFAAIGMDKQTLRILEMVFNGPGKGDYILVETLKEAQACIFDLDCLNGMNLWKDYRNQNSHLPTLIFSLNDKDIAGTVYVKKPIEIEQLLKALSKIKRLLKEQPLEKTLQAVSGKSGSSERLAPRNAQLATDMAIEKEEEAIHQFCGYTQDINPDNPEDVKKIYYDPSQYLQGFFEKSFVIAQQLDGGGILIEGLYTPMILLQKQNIILCGNEFRNHQLRTMALLPLSKNRLRLVTLSETEVEEHKRTEHLVARPLDEFLWRVALWTSRGRIAKGTDLSKKIVLLHWPNFTRLVVTPYALRISALWIAQPHSLLETTKILNIPQRYVFSFFSAASALQLAFVDRRTEQRSSQSTPSNNTKHGLFKRLLARLRHQE
ncbi:MAG TPA: hypothetical protein EYP59_15295 [Thiotrichaceae bacterium]|nr:hypothetical protein [Thiotrichaceae bacterium]